MERPLGHPQASSRIGVHPEKKLFWLLVRARFFFFSRLVVQRSSSSSSGTAGFLSSLRSMETWLMSPISFSTCFGGEGGQVDLCVNFLFKHHLSR